MPRSRFHRRVLFFGLIIAFLFAAWGIGSRIMASHALKSETEEAAVPAVSVMKAESMPSVEEVILPGTVQAWHEAPIYARTNGYVKGWKTDIGAKVEKGDLLAEIETPEVDAQLHQAEADLATSQANAKLAQTTAVRWKALLKTNSVSQQETDEKVAAAAAQTATMASAQANVDRLRQLEGFKRVVAPFAGTITARNIDDGSLINAGSGTAAGVEMFHIADVDRLRVYVQVPEIYTTVIAPGLEAELHFTEHPGKVFKAALLDTAHAYDPATRTLLVQFEADNTDGVLIPGGYTETHLKLAGSKSSVKLPVNTLIFRSAGLQAAVIDGDGKAQLKDITAGRDFGKAVEIVSGVSPGDTVVVNPPDSLISGEKVRVVTPEEEKQKDGGKEEKSDDKDEKREKKPAKDENKITPQEKEEGVVIKNDSQGSGGKQGDKKDDKQQ